MKLTKFADPLQIQAQAQVSYYFSNYFHANNI